MNTLLQKIPQIINISDIQRQPTKSTDVEVGEYKIVTNGGREKAVIMNIQTFREIMNTLQKTPILPRPRSIHLSSGLKKILKNVDPVEYQRNIRKEY